MQVNNNSKQYYRRVKMTWSRIHFYFYPPHVDFLPLFRPIFLFRVQQITLCRTLIQRDRCVAPGQSLIETGHEMPRQFMDSGKRDSGESVEEWEFHWRFTKISVMKKDRIRKEVATLIRASSSRHPLDLFLEEDGRRNSLQRIRRSQWWRNWNLRTFSSCGPSSCYSHELCV